MCSTCLTIEHQDGDWIFRHVFGHHQQCPELDVSKIRTGDLVNRLRHYIESASNEKFLKKLASYKGTETRRRNNSKPAKDRPVRENDIQDVLYKNLRWQKKHKWIAPNVDIFSTGEMDLCSMAPSGLVHEYEIKLTRSDFLADRKKDHKHPQLELVMQGVSTRTVQSRWSQHTYPLTAPNYYTYVVPADMVTVEEVPAYAGLVYVNLDKLWNYGLALNFVKPAKLLHKTKADEIFKLAIGEKLMFRCWTAREKLTKQHAMTQETA